MGSIGKNEPTKKCEESLIFRNLDQRYSIGHLSWNKQTHANKRQQTFGIINVVAQPTKTATSTMGLIIQAYI